MLKLRLTIHTFAMLLICMIDSANSTAHATSPIDAAKPNIVWIMADDLGLRRSWLLWTKSNRNALPRSNGEGRYAFHPVLLRCNCLCAFAKCSDDGLHHGHTRVRGNAGKKNPKAQALRENDFTVARLLQQSGYRTALIGKWGLGDAGEAESGLPRKQGFDEFYGFLNQSHAHNHFPIFSGETKRASRCQTW